MDGGTFSDPLAALYLLLFFFVFLDGGFYGPFHSSLPFSYFFIRRFRQTAKSEKCSHFTHTGTRGLYGGFVAEEVFKLSSHTSVTHSTAP